MADEVKTKKAEADGILPDKFYTTTNFRTEVFIGKKWVPVKDQKMDSAIVIQGSKASCKKPYDVKKGEEIVVGHGGIQMAHEASSKEKSFFMSSESSTESSVRVFSKKLAKEMDWTKKMNGKIGIVAGPGVIHSGGRDYLASMVRNGFVDFIFAGNGFATHDMEADVYGTTLGRDIHTHEFISHHNHMWMINTVKRLGSIKRAVREGVVKSGVMYECVRNKIPYVLAGSIRDDGPLPDVITDAVVAQHEMMKLFQDADLVLMLSTALHSIAAANLLKFDTNVVCVDINPNVITKLRDRGSAQTKGLVTDVETFLMTLETELSKYYKNKESKE